MHPAIRVTNVTKRFRLGGRVRGGLNLTERFAALVRRAPRKDSDFWALKGVSFEVKPGEVVGIIGRNGAGKSTLLKVLSRIVEPTEGRVELRGRVGSLLEVGTGFHPELTGRENVYLNGSVLGMSRREIARSFDAIVAFSGVEQFLDTPVKRYSSGMYVRLAFAVAAHLEPEILIVDEVLAVGDAAFQRKCLGKIGEIARSGRTVLLVSHNAVAVRNLCTAAILLDSGCVIASGPTAAVLNTYLSGQQADARAEYDLSGVARSGSRQPIMRAIRLLDGAGRPTRHVVCGEPLTIEFDVRLDRAADTPQLGAGVDDQWGQRVFSVGSFLAPDDLPALPAGDSTVRCHIPAVPLTPGRYTLSLSIGYALAELADQVEGLVAFDVEAGDFFGNGRLPSPELGQTLVRSDWSVRGGDA
ncbi:ABC transporter ATP-binding protein [Frigoriglobus tundricola]|nr:ABC transporter ATP-binding protein [Frigoriglobus tundricola]